MSLPNTDVQTRYVLITPARDEEQHIEETIKSVLSQAVKPARWVIVDDRSTDRTAEIVGKYLPASPFITLLRLDGIGRRNFGSKVAAFNAGLMLLEGTQYTFIGNLDADISFAPDYYANILAEFQNDPILGVAGGIVYTRTGIGFSTDDTAPDSVGGAVQVFRRDCFDQIGGYIPLPNGGIDAAAEIMARMNGWTVRKFPENKVWEHRRTGSAGTNLLASMYKLGVRFHALGYSTGFFILRSAYKAKSRPFLVGSAATLLGFLWARLRRYPMSLPPEAVSYLRAEQRNKLKEFLFGTPDRTITVH
ncbi:MAG TPA: glycosyltransferase family A protein [Terriglobia bacterium]|nr:glycosyltransferase family A protein [Terriglobia bacterium]